MWTFRHYTPIIEVKGETMNQIKIGKFIAERRRCVGLTQMQLAEMLNITDRAVSKWECGRALPDASIMLELCRILEISVNDLLSGEVVSVDNYNKEMESRLLEMIKQKEESDRRLLRLEVVIGILSTIILIVPVFIGALLPMEDWLRLIVVFSGFIPALVGFFCAIRIEQMAGYYVCKHCNYIYVPTYKSVTMAAHVGRTRYMKCPSCGKSTWNKKVVRK